jgi:hypothetical protein
LTVGFVAKNVIYIPNIVRLAFLDALSRSDLFTMVMPGNYGNVVWPIGWAGGSASAFG